MKLIPLSAKRNGKRKGKFFAQVDDSDYEYLMQWNWQPKKSKLTYYAIRNIKYPNGHRDEIRMHRQILGLKGKLPLVDHKDRDGLNNQGNNIRIATHSQNSINRTPTGTSKYMGVSWSKSSKKWIATIVVNGKQRYLGGFKNEIDAAIIYNQIASECHGRFANLNII